MAEFVKLSVETRVALIDRQRRVNAESAYEIIIAKRGADMTKDTAKSEQLAKILENLIKQNDLLDTIESEEKAAK